MYREECSPLCVAFLTGARTKRQKKMCIRNETRRKTISSKKVEIYSHPYAIFFARSLRRFFFCYEKSVSRKLFQRCTTLIDMFECVFQVGLMMCNSTFSTTAKCAFPIFILNYFALAQSLVSLVMFKKTSCGLVRTHATSKLCGKDDEPMEVFERKTHHPNPKQHFCHPIQNCTNISHKLTFIAF